MLGFAFSSTILCRASAGGLSGLNENQDDRSTLQTSSKHVPVLCPAITVHHSLEFILISPGPRLLPLQAGILSSLPFHFQTAPQVWRRTQVFLGHEPLAGRSVVCVPRLWVTLRKPYYWTEMCFGLTWLLFLYKPQYGHQCVQVDFDMFMS